VSVKEDFGEVEDAILIGNFGDGHINVYNKSGDFKGQLKEKGKALTIPGLWAITFDNVAPVDPNKLYFTAGPDEETHGLFGYVNSVKKESGKVDESGKGKDAEKK
jgi:uncharacterized protein (TIGR03118 family)